MELLMCGLFLLTVDSVQSINLQSRTSSKKLIFQRGGNKSSVHLAVVMPHSFFQEKEYQKKMYATANGFSRMEFQRQFSLEPFVQMLQKMPGPTEVLSKICDQFLMQNIASVVYITNSEKYGRETVASQYFLELAKYVGLPVISWNADNAALEKSSFQLQLAPTIRHQAMAIMSLLQRYNWHTFSVITSHIGGYTAFSQTFRELEIQSVTWDQQLKIIDVLNIRPDQFKQLERTENRIFILYATKKEAHEMLRQAKRLGLTTKEYVWIVTQPVIGADLAAPLDFPPGMLGVHFDTDTKALVSEIETAMTVFAYGLNKVSTQSEEKKLLMTKSDVSCYNTGPVQWRGGEELR